MCVQGHRSLIDSSHEEWSWAGVVEPELGGKHLGNLREYGWAHLCLHTALLVSWTDVRWVQGCDRKERHSLGELSHSPRRADGSCSEAPGPA